MAHTKKSLRRCITIENLNHHFWHTGFFPKSRIQFQKHKSDASAVTLRGPTKKYQSWFRKLLFLAVQQQALHFGNQWEWSRVDSKELLHLTGGKFTLILLLLECNRLLGCSFALLTRWPYKQRNLLTETYGFPWSFHQKHYVLEKDPRFSNMWNS